MQTNMTRRCIVEGCDSRSGAPKHVGVTYHSFPFDSKTRDIWLINTRVNPDKNITKSVVVCSRHFRQADFQPFKVKYMLKPGAVPTIFPWGEIPHAEVTGSVGSDTSQHDEESEISPVSDSSSQRDSTTDSPITAATVGITSNQGSAGILPSEQIVIKSEPNLTAVKLAHPDKVIESSKKIDDIDLNMENRMDIETKPKTNTITKNSFTTGEIIEALDYDGIWHPARVVEVDNEEREILIRIEKSAKSKTPNSGIEEWIAMNSSRLRERQVQQPVPVSKNTAAYQVGARVVARWTGNRRFPAVINKILDNDTYEVLFDDGFVKTVKASHISKMKTPAARASSAEKKRPSTPKTTPTQKSQTKSDWPLITMSSLNLDELNLPPIPTDGEWCCHWVNDQPIGREGFLTVGDHKKPTVIVDDWRLPANWTKHMYQRSNILGKWDVILVNPNGKRFRSKADLKVYIEEMGQTYNPDIYDFSIHRRRAKDLKAYVYTKDYKATRNTVPSADKSTSETTVTTGGADVSDNSPVPGTSGSTATAPAPVEPVTPQPAKQPIPELPTITPKEEVSHLEDGYVYVGLLKVKIVDNLFSCPQEECNKNFRKENHLQIHIKHYHEELAALLGVFPNMQELAYKRTIGQPTDDPVPKNHLPNAQFFAKLHQQDLQTKHHRKSHSTPSHPGTSTPPLITTPVLTSPTPKAMEIEIKLEPKLEEVSDIEIKQSPTQTVPETANVDTSVVVKESPAAVVAEPSEKTDLKSKVKFRKTDGGNRKSSRQRLTKRYFEPNTTGTFDTSFQMNDFEETRHSFNGTPEGKNPKRLKLQHSEVAEGIDGNSHTAGSFPDHSQSPKYIKENGEVIKIVRMKQEEIIHCLCSYGEEDGLMIQCELCLCWQHGICNGIEKQNQVPEKYICYICRNPQRGRASLKYIHDQDWLYEGKLPVANYHAPNPAAEERFNVLRKTHTLTGNLLELRRFMHSLKVKINIAENKDHPKMYLWAKKWETSPVKEIKSEDAAKVDAPDQKNQMDVDSDDVKQDNNLQTDVTKQEGDGKPDVNFNPITIPQPEKAIDPVECQHRLLEHIQKQQSCVMDMLQAIEAQITDIETNDNGSASDTEDCARAEKVIAMYIKDLEKMRNIAKINNPQTNTFVPC